MNVTLRQLRAFVAVAQTGSFTLAAERLCVSQSALSGLIKELEQSLGLRLLDRSTRRIELSQVGEAIYPLVEKVLVDLDGTLSEVASIKTLSRGVVRVAASQLMACTLLPEVMSAFAKLYPDIVVKLVDCEVQSISARVFAGEVDFGVGPERDANSDVMSDELFELPFYAVLRPDHRLVHSKSICWGDLTDEVLITLHGEFTDRLSADLRQALRERHLKPDTTVTYMSTALSMVAAGLGCTVCIPYAKSLIQRYELVMRPLVQPEVWRRFYVFTKVNRSMSPAARAFLEFMGERMRGALDEFA